MTLRPLVRMHVHVNVRVTRSTLLRRSVLGSTEPGGAYIHVHVDAHDMVSDA